MGHFNKDRGNRFGGGKPWEKRGGDRDRGEVTMHQATCAECGDRCEVPFRPMQGKPVYCKNCFAAKGGSRGEDRGPSRDFTPRQNERHFSNTQFSGNNDDTKRQLEALDTKFDRLIKLVEAYVQPKAVEAKPISVKEVKLLPPELTKGIVKKVTKKKVAKKK